jgi:hypothetical protein
MLYQLLGAITAGTFGSAGRYCRKTVAGSAGLELLQENLLDYI